MCGHLHVSYVANSPLFDLFDMEAGCSVEVVGRRNSSGCIIVHQSNTLVYKHNLRYHLGKKW